jgi:hypothetical protein
VPYSSSTLGVCSPDLVPVPPILRAPWNRVQEHLLEHRLSPLLSSRPAPTMAKKL